MSISQASRRLFLALWPDQAVCAALQQVGRAWPWPAGATRYLHNDWHVTLHFLGAVDETRIAKLLPVLALPFEPFTLALERPEAWPRGLVVLCPCAAPVALLALQQHLGQALLSCGVSVEARVYRPHLTLARRAAVPLPQQVEPVTWRVQDYWLVESTGDPQKRYRPLVRYTSAGGWQALAPVGAPKGAP